MSLLVNDESQWWELWWLVIQHLTSYAIVVEVSQFGSCYIAIYLVMNLITLYCEMWNGIYIWSPYTDMIKQTHYITACNTYEWLIATEAPSSGGIYCAE